MRRNECEPALKPLSAPTADSEDLRPGNPIERGQAFRSKAATLSDEGDRAPLSA
jgi:hypothetical protein